MSFFNRILCTCLIGWLLLSILACSNQSPVDPWEAVKNASKLKKRVDAQKNLLQIPATVYAAMLALECQSDENKCIEATGVVHFALAISEGEESFPARAACTLYSFKAIDFLTKAHNELEFRVVDAMSRAEDTARLRDMQSKIEQTRSSYSKVCDKKK